MLKIRVVKAMLRVTAAAAISLLVALSASAQTIRYVHTDGLGSVVLTTDKDRNIVERSEYEPYGSLLNRPLTDGPGYTGHVMDAATGLTYMQQRYYDQAIGLFLSADPVAANSLHVENFNRYRYANNNPYKLVDPDGRQVHRPGDKPDRYIDGSCVEGGGSCVTFSAGSGSVLARHKTPKSQDELIESVGGDVETMRYAREMHGNFVGALSGFAAGGGLGFGRRVGTTTLYRAVTEAEAISIREIGKFSTGPNSLGGKWLAETLEHAQKWGDLMNGKGVSKILEVKLPKPVADQLMRLERLDGVGPARYGELNQLEQATIREIK